MTLVEERPDQRDAAGNLWSAEATSGAIGAETGQRVPVSASRNPPRKQPHLSVVVRVVGGGRFLRRCLGTLCPQIGSCDAEVIVPYDSAVRGVGELASQWPNVRLLDLGYAAPNWEHPAVGHKLYDQRTARGLSQAKGEIIALIEDTVLPAGDWCEQVIRAHRELRHGVIGGSIKVAATGGNSWAVHLMDFGRYQPPLQEGPTRYLSDVNVSYKLETRLSVRQSWKDQYNEITVHRALAEAGETLWLRPQIAVSQDRGKLSMKQLTRERFYWGRLFGAIRAQELSGLGRATYVLASPAIPWVLLARMAWKALFMQRGNGRRFLGSLGRLVVLVWCWGVGESVGYVTGRES